MAAIYDPERNLDLVALSKNLQKALPAYARPQFIRLLEKVDLTGTFKLKKLDLQKEGFNPGLVQDKLYYLNNKSGAYELLTVDLYDKIMNSEIRF
jgi:solute carrier family 27 fatty acid transporter 1/4